MTSTSIIWLIFAGLVAVFVYPYIRGILKREKNVLEAHAESLEYGLYRPASLHPVVDPDNCIGTGNCVEVCPEKDVLGLLSGQATPVSPARCIGHGLCERSCPVNAIELVFGTAKRGVDLPRIKENFESNVTGLFVVGELGGMGLICNAFEQGKQCIQGIDSSGERGTGDVLDLLIVGCGPAGLSCALTATRCGLSYVVLEKDSIGGTVATYPRKKLVMTEPMKLSSKIHMKCREYRKEELLEIWNDIVVEKNLNIRENQTVISVSRTAAGHFEIKSRGEIFRAKSVVLAIGRRGIPRKLGVPGETGVNVSHSLKDPAHFEGDSVLVVGGGDSAIEAAISLSEQTNTGVHLSYRNDTFVRAKDANRRRLEQNVASGGIRLLLNTNVESITTTNVLLERPGEGPIDITNDYVFIFAGGTLPTQFLTECGLKIDTKFGAKVSSSH